MTGKRERRCVVHLRVGSCSPWPQPLQALFRAGGLRERVPTAKNKIASYPGNWALATGDWQPEAGNCQPPTGP